MSYTSLLWVSLSYNPSLLGALPAGFTGSKLFAWSANRNSYYSANTIYSSGGTYGTAPTYGSGILYGTSVGLNRSMISILRDVQAGLDPTGALSSSWGSTDLQPCPPWLSNTVSYPGQNSSTPAMANHGRESRAATWLGAMANHGR